MEIRNIAHKGLKRLYENNDSKGLPAPAVDRLRKIFAFLDAIEDARELRTVPVWKAHLLTAQRKGTWSLHVTRNWRLTLWIDDAERKLCDVNFEDYH